LPTFAPGISPTRAFLLQRHRMNMEEGSSGLQIERIHDELTIR
jgi:hypothetical protein